MQCLNHLSEYEETKNQLCFFLVEYISYMPYVFKIWEGLFWIVRYAELLYLSKNKYIFI